MRRILLIIFAAVSTWLAISFFTYQPHLEDDLIFAVIIDEFDDLSGKISSKFETQNTVTGIEISFNGQLKGNGILTIGDSDSTSYRNYQLVSGKVDIEHKSDWYSKVCYITFAPTTETTGKISIELNFLGD